ncbi:COG4223 family protein [Rhodobacter sp. CZR27]|uniref:COG4223 family protein n=1 Tax=Rhodobacter sp. CZR27 TaxID=2033869 RepID=UPI000BBE304E|nr:hypothetical protein [Rhodobacter sp. CZR27]
MSEPESREAGEKKREDDSPEPLTLSQPEPVEPEGSPADEPFRDGERSDESRALPDEAEIIAEMPPASDSDGITRPDEDLARPEPVVASSPRRPEPARGSGTGGLVLLLLGGIAGAAGGFAYSRHAKPDWPLADYGQTTQVAAQQRELEDLRAQLAALPEPTPAPVVTEGPSAAELAEAQQRAAAAEARIAELEAQLAQAASQPAAPVGDAGALQQEIAALRDQIAQASGSAVTDAQAEAEKRVADAEAQAARLKAEVEAAARAATTAAAVAQVRASIDAGTPYAAPLEALASKGVEIPMKLIETAEAGVPTLPALEDSFPPAAREALAVSRRATMGDSWTSRARAFLLTEAGLRSLSPREGSDPDAILSRAEAAVHGADLPKALEEIATLPAEGQAAMAGWAAEAKKRIEAIDAVAALAAAAEGK